MTIDTNNTTGCFSRIFITLWVFELLYIYHDRYENGSSNPFLYTRKILIKISEEYPLHVKRSVRSVLNCLGRVHDIFKSKKKKIRQSKNMSDTVFVACQYQYGTHVRHRLHQMCLCFLAHNIIGLNSTLINN